MSEMEIDEPSCSAPRAWTKDQLIEIAKNNLETTGSILDGSVDAIFTSKSKREVFIEFIERENLNAIKSLTKDEKKFLYNVDVKLWIELISLCIEKDFLEIFKKLKKFEEKYANNLNGIDSQNAKRRRRNSCNDEKFRECMGFKYKSVLFDIRQFHENISQGKIKEVESFIEKYPKLKLCRDIQGVSALEMSIDARKFEVYALIRAKGFCSDKGPQLFLKIQNLSNDEKEKIRLEILKFTISDPIGLILTKCDLDACSEDIPFNKIRDMLDTLIKINGFRPVLEILALSDVKIVFDFKTESVVDMVPSENDSTLGLTYFKEGTLYVGKNKSSEKLYGTFAQEATHQVMHLIYENNCLPYRAEHHEKKGDWDEIFKNTREIYEDDKEGTDDIIRSVFEAGYKEGDEQSLELITRVNEFYATFHNEPEKCEAFREKFVELNEFYECEVLPDLSKDFYRIIKLNNDLELLDLTKDSNFKVKSCGNFQLLNFKENVQKISLQTSQNLDRQKFAELNQKIQNFDSKNFLLLSDVSQLTLSKLFNEISESSSNKLHTKVKNIFINFEMFQQKSLKQELGEVLKNLEKSKSLEDLRLIINLNFDCNQRDEEKLKKKIEESLEFLKHSTKIQIFLIASSNSEPILKILNEVFKIDASKVEIESENLKIIEENFETCKSSQSAVKFLKVNLKHSWSDLTEISQKEILKLEVKFRDQIFPLNLFYSYNSAPSAETLNSFNSQQNIKMIPKAPKEIKKFIERKFSKTKKYLNSTSDDSDEETESSDEETDIDSSLSSGDSEETKNNLNLTFGEFIEKTKNKTIVVISDIAGSGKTTLLHKIHQNLNENLQTFWICFVGLLEHKKLLLDLHEICENFLEFVAHKILKLNELERKTFELKYERNEVVILFDAFDEISPDCKLNALKVFKSHKESGKSKIFITTRTHLKIDLERELQVKAYGLVALTSEQQVEFLCKYWEETCNNSNLRENCAKNLVEKLDEINGEKSLIGIALLVRLFGEYFKDKLSEDFEEEIKNLNLSQVYEFLLESSVKSKDENSIHNLLKLNSEIYETLAVKQYLGHDGHHLFGKASAVEDLDDEKLEELTRDGIIFYDDDKQISFIHRTFLEFFVWRFISNRIKNFKKNWEHEKEFFELLMELLRSCVTRLDKCFQELSKAFDGNSQKKFESVKDFSESFHNFIIKKKNFNWIGETFYSKISHSALFVLKSIKFESGETLKKIIESESPYSFSKTSYFLIFIEHVRDPEIFEEFFDEVFKIYPKNSELFDFLIRSDEHGETVFHKIIDENYFNIQIFLKFWSKVEEQQFGCEKFLQIFFTKNRNDENIFTKTLDKFDGRIDAMIKIMKKNLKLEDLRKILREFHIKFFKCEKTFLKFLEFMKEIFEPGEICEIFTSTDENSRTFLHQSTWHINKKIFKIIIDELQKSKKENFREILKEFLMKRDKRSGQIALMTNCYLPFKQFCFIFDEIFCKFLAFKDFAFEIDNFGKTIPHHLISRGNFNCLKFLMEKAEKELSEEELKSFCKLKTKNFKNVFHLNAGQNRPTENMVNNLFNNFDKEEMRKILSELDDKLQLPLHEAAKYEANFRVFFDLYENNFDGKEILKFFEMKDIEGKNVFHLLAKNCYANDDVANKANYFFSKFSKEEMRKLLSKRDNEHRLPLHHAGLKNEIAFRNILDLYKKSFNAREILKFLQLENKKGKNVKKNL